MRTSQDLKTLLDLDSDFAVATFSDFPKKDHKASGTVIDALQKVTGSGSMLLIAGCMLWVARRLAKVTDVTRCYHAAEALLCYQDSPTYFRPTTHSEWPSVDEPNDDAMRAVSELSGSLWSVFAISPGRHPLPPSVIHCAGETVTMTRTVLGPKSKKPFEAWLKQMFERLHQYALNPRVAVRMAQADTRLDFSVEKHFKAENMGPPLPPALLDPRFTPSANDFGALYTEFLSAVDWKNNPFLASPETMLARGFGGTPYVPTPGAHYASAHGAPQPEVATSPELPVAPVTHPASAPAIQSPYPFLAQLEAMPKTGRSTAMQAYLASRNLPAHFGEAELELEHAFSLLLKCQVGTQAGTYVGMLSASTTVLGDLYPLIEDKRPRVPALQMFEPEIDVTNQGEEARDLILTVVKESKLDTRTRGDFIVIKGDKGIVGRLTRGELKKVAEDLEPMVLQVQMTAPSDGSLFDALRFMVQQEIKPWGMSKILDVGDLTVDVVDAKLESALEAVENRDLAEDLSAFCDRDGRSARAWRHKGIGKSFKDQTLGVQLTVIAGVYDGEGVGMDFNVYKVG